MGNFSDSGLITLACKACISRCRTCSVSDPCLPCLEYRSAILHKPPAASFFKTNEVSFAVRHLHWLPSPFSHQSKKPWRRIYHIAADPANKTESRQQVMTIERTPKIMLITRSRESDIMRSFYEFVTG